MFLEDGQLSYSLGGREVKLGENQVFNFYYSYLIIIWMFIFKNYMYMYGCVWKAEVNLKCLSRFLPTFDF